MSAILKRARTGVLDIAYEESGPAEGLPVFLLHGWPYDVRTYDDVVPRLVAAGCRTIVPYRAASAPRTSSPPTRRAPDSRPRSERICWT
jgi:pimeloyl-ACP methyl ester carboxylesterase